MEPAPGASDTGGDQIIRAVDVPVVPGGVIRDRAQAECGSLSGLSFRTESQEPTASSSTWRLSGGLDVPNRFHEERARVAVLSRYHPYDYPELVAARQRMNEEVLVNAVTKALAKAPPLRPEVRDRIVALLSVDAAA